IGNAADGDPVGLFLVPKSMKAILYESNGRFLKTVQGTLGTYEGSYRRFLEFQWLKFRGITNPYEIYNNLNFYYGREISPVLRFTLTFGVIFVPGVFGVAFSLSRRNISLLY